jgi:Mor family transcriptional regulator
MAVLAIGRHIKEELMAAKAYGGRTIITDMAEGCTGLVKQSVAIKALRAVCRYFGGQLLYIPITKNTGDTTSELRGVLVEAVGDASGERILGKMMSLFGGSQVYIPMEKNAFRDIIAREIYERYDGDKEKIRDISREYGISFSQVYRLWAEGRDNKKQNVKKNK